MASVDVVHVSDEAEQLEHDQNIAATVDYGDFLKLPRNHTAINGLCECLLNSLEQRFGYSTAHV